MQLQATKTKWTEYQLWLCTFFSVNAGIIFYNFSFKPSPATSAQEVQEMFSNISAFTAATRATLFLAQNLFLARGKKILFSLPFSA